MTSVKAIFGGDTRGFEAATAKIGLIAKANAANIATSYKNELVGVQKALATLPQQSTLAPKLLARESFLKKALGLDKVSVAAIAADATKAAEAAERAATEAAVRQAERNNRARAIRRQRAESRAEREAGMPMLGPSSDAFYKWQIEQAERNNRARALRRERRAEQVERWQEQTAAMRGGMGGFSHGGIAVGGSSGRRMNFAVAGSMFTSVARDSAASLASGAPITQVIAQQAPQVLQALAMMKAGTLAWIAVLAGAGVFAWHKITKGIAESVAGVQKLTLEGERLKRQGEATKGARRAADTWEQEALDAKTQQLETEAAMRERENTADKLKRDRENIDRARMGDLSPQAQARFELANEQAAIYRQIAQEKEFGGNRGAGERNKMESEIIGLQQVATGETEEERRVKDLKIASLRASINSSINQAALDSQNAVTELENRAAKIALQIDESKKDEAKVETKQTERKMRERTAATTGFFALSEWERAGGRMAGPAIQQDVSKMHYNEAKTQTRLLTEIKTRLRGGASF